MARRLLRSKDLKKRLARRKLKSLVTKAKSKAKKKKTKSQELSSEGRKQIKSAILKKLGSGGGGGGLHKALSDLEHQIKKRREENPDAYHIEED